MCCVPERLKCKEQKLIGALGYFLPRVSNRLRLKEERPDFSEEISNLVSYQCCNHVIDLTASTAHPALSSHPTPSQDTTTPGPSDLLYITLQFLTPSYSQRPILVL